jgi:hypothetical protein
LEARARAIDELAEQGELEKTIRQVHRELRSSRALFLGLESTAVFAAWILTLEYHLETLGLYLSPGIVGMTLLAISVTGVSAALVGRRAIAFARRSLVTRRVKIGGLSSMVTLTIGSQRAVSRVRECGVLLGLRNLVPTQDYPRQRSSSRSSL